MGGIKTNFLQFCFSHFMFSSRFMLFATFLEKKVYFWKYWKMLLHLFEHGVKLKVASPDSRWGQWESISNISSMPLFWFLILSVGGGGDAVSKCRQQIFENWVNIFLAFYAISNIFRKKIPGGGGGVTKMFVVLASEPVGGRSRVTGLPCI